MGYKPNTPVFIIGTGRCGTTLLVKILDSHPQLIGFPGEANSLWHPKSYPFATKSIETPSIIENPELFTALSVKSWPPNHEKKLKNTFAGYHLMNGIRQTFFVKSAMISFMVPKILTLYPEAKFIHIYRNGPAVVESFLKKEWEKYQSIFDSEDEARKNCAHYWNACLLEIEKQRVKCALDSRNVFLEFSYEQLCDMPEDVLGKIGRFLNISTKEFTFDLTKIVSQNYKVGEYTNDEKWDQLLTIMAPAMKLKGYLS